MSEPLEEFEEIKITLTREWRLVRHFSRLEARMIKRLIEMVENDKANKFLLTIACEESQKDRDKYKEKWEGEKNLSGNLSNHINQLQEENKKFKSMIENGLGFEDLIDDH